MLDGGGEETVPLNFFPEIKAGLGVCVIDLAGEFYIEGSIAYRAPIRCDIVQVKLDVSPDRRCLGASSIIEQPVDVADHRDSSKGGSIALRATREEILSVNGGKRGTRDGFIPPRSSESSLVNVELGLSQATSRNGSRRIGDLLETTLGGDPILDAGSEGAVRAGSELIDNPFVDQGGITGPGIAVTVSQ